MRLQTYYKSYNSIQLTQVCFSVIFVVELSAYLQNKPPTNVFLYTNAAIFSMAAIFCLATFLLLKRDLSHDNNCSELEFTSICINMFAFALMTFIFSIMGLTALQLLPFSANQTIFLFVSSCFLIIPSILNLISLYKHRSHFVPGLPYTGNAAQYRGKPFLWWLDAISKCVQVVGFFCLYKATIEPGWLHPWKAHIIPVSLFFLAIITPFLTIAKYSYEEQLCPDNACRRLFFCG